MRENSHVTGWRKSSYSNGTGECVEVATWRKSSYSNSQGNCLEAATWRTPDDSAAQGACVGVTDRRTPTGSAAQGECVRVGKATTAVLVRDTANRSGAILAVSAETWRALLAKVRAS